MNFLPGRGELETGTDLNEWSPLRSASWRTEMMERISCGADTTSHCMMYLLLADHRECMQDIASGYKIKIIVSLLTKPRRPNAVRLGSGSYSACRSSSLKALAATLDRTFRA